MLVEVNHARDMIHFEDGFARYETFDPAFFAENDPSSDLFRVLDRLAGKLVVMQPQLSFESDTRTPRNLPAEVAKLGAKLVLVPLGDAPGHLRDFLEAVAFLVRDGLPRDVALKALTLHPAKLLGLGGELGAIEAGLRADLIFLDGDPLGASPHVTRVMIGGELREPEGARQ